MTRCWHRNKHLLSNWASIHPHMQHKEDDHLPLLPEDQPDDLNLSLEENGQHIEHPPDQAHLPPDDHQDGPNLPLEENDPHIHPFPVLAPSPLNVPAPELDAAVVNSKSLPSLFIGQVTLGEEMLFLTQKGGKKETKMEVVVLPVTREEERMGVGDPSHEAKEEKLLILKNCVVNCDFYK